MISPKQVQFLGGVYNVANLAARNALPADIAQVGMLVNVLNDGTGQQVLFQLQALPASTSSNWLPYGFDFSETWFGTGFDGSLAPGFGNIVLTRNTFYQDVQPKTDGTDTIDMATFDLIIAGTLFLRGCPAGIIFSTAANGNPGIGTGAGGAAPATNFVASHSLGGGATGTAGGAGGAAGGSQGAAPPGLGNAAGGTGSGVNSGAGGSGSGGGGGALRAGAVATRVAGSTLGIPTPPGVMWYGSQDGNPNFAPHMITGGQCGTGGGGGGGDGTAGAGAGSGGTGGAAARLFARTIDRDGTTAAACIRANGGNGGAGASTAAGNRGGGGGGSGAAGGALQVVAGSLTGSVAANALAADGGNGGNGGNGTGTGTGGTGGDGGRSGQVALFVLQTRGFNVIGPDVAGTAGSAPVGTAGGAGGNGGQARSNL